MGRSVEVYALSGAISFTDGYAHWEATTIGGQTADGRDATNALSHLILRSKREFPLNYPDLAARIHSRTPDVFLHDVCETIKGLETTLDHVMDLAIVGEKKVHRH